LPVAQEWIELFGHDAPAELRFRALVASSMPSVQSLINAVATVADAMLSRSAVANRLH
jgi:hypothetical protein